MFVRNLPDRKWILNIDIIVAQYLPMLTACLVATIKGRNVQVLGHAFVPAFADCCTPDVQGTRRNVNQWPNGAICGLRFLQFNFFLLKLNHWPLLSPVTDRNSKLERPSNSDGKLRDLSSCQESFVHFARYASKMSMLYHSGNTKHDKEYHFVTVRETNVVANHSKYATVQCVFSYFSHCINKLYTTISELQLQGLCW